MTSVMIVTSDVVSLEKRGTYQGILGMVVAMANSLGPLIGGAFSEKASWRWCFVGSPQCEYHVKKAYLLYTVYQHTPNQYRYDHSHPRSSPQTCQGRCQGQAQESRLPGLHCHVSVGNLDPHRVIVVRIALGFNEVRINLKLISYRGGTSYAWNSAGVLAPLIIGIVLLGVFIYVEMKVATLPLIPSKHYAPVRYLYKAYDHAVHIFRNSTVAGANGGAFFTGFMFYCNLYYVGIPYPAQSRLY